MLSRDDIRRALLALAGEFADMSVRCEVVVIGGAAVVLLYGAREATKDVDVLILGGIDPTLVRGAVQRVAGALDRDDVWRHVEPHVVPGRETKAYYAFCDLWEAEHGST